MPTYFSNTDTQTAYLGGLPVSNVYMGDTLLWGITTGCSITNKVFSPYTGTTFYAQAGTYKCDNDIFWSGSVPSNYVMNVIGVNAGGQPVFDYIANTSSSYFDFSSAAPTAQKDDGGFIYSLQNFSLTSQEGYSLELLFKTPETSVNEIRDILVFNSLAGGGVCIWLQYDIDNKLILTTDLVVEEGGIPNRKSVRLPNPLGNNVWYHVVLNMRMVHNGPQDIAYVDFYVDGNFLNTSTIGSENNPVSIHRFNSVVNTTQIGANDLATGDYNIFPGYIAVVGTHPNLDATQVNEIYSQYTGSYPV